MLGMAALEPRFIWADKMDHIDAGLKMPIGWDILVVTRWRDVVGERQAMRVIFEVHV